MKIRKARLKDAKGIYLKFLKKPYRDAYTNQLIIDLIKNKLSICLVAEQNNRIVGVLGARREGHKAYWIYFVEVKKKFRNKSVKDFLMKKFFNNIKKLKANKIAVDTPNKKFFLRFGFKEIGKLPNWQKSKSQFIMFKKIK